jgi:hypothetical protein
MGQTRQPGRDNDRAIELEFQRAQPRTAVPCSRGPAIPWRFSQVRRV